MISDNKLGILGKLQIETYIGELKNLDTLLNQDFRFPETVAEGHRGVQK